MNTLRLALVAVVLALALVSVQAQMDPTGTPSDPRCTITFKGAELEFQKCNIEGDAERLGGDFEAYWNIVDDEIELAIRREGRAGENGYIAWGFSGGGNFPMIGSDAVVAWIDESRSGDDAERIEDYNLDSQESDGVTIQNNQNLISKAVEKRGNVLTMVFKRKLEVRGTFPASDSGDTSIIYAYNDFSAPSSGSARLQEHGSRFFGTINFATGDAAVKENVYRKIHGALMGIAWGLFLPVGIIIARYKDELGGKWFMLHRGLQMLGLTVALAGWIIALTEVGTGTEKTHRGLGWFVMVVGLMQPINAFFRPHKEESGEQSKKRVYWFWMHAVLGRSAALLGVVNVFIGLQILGVSTGVTAVVAVGVTAWGLASVVLEVRHQRRLNEKKNDPKLADDRDDVPGDKGLDTEGPYV